MGSSHLQRIASVCMLLILLAGCSKEEMKKFASDTTKVVQDTTATAAKNVETMAEGAGETTADMQEKLNMAGSIDLTAGGPIKTEACYAYLHPQGSRPAGAKRAAILQLRSYRDQKSEAFPSVFLQAQVRVNSISELTIDPIKARLFVQLEKDGKVLFSEAGTPVTLEVTAVDEKSLKAKLVGASLVDTGGGGVEATGQFEGVWQ